VVTIERADAFNARCLAFLAELQNAKKAVA
jgi:hypothetical protein